MENMFKENQIRMRNRRIEQQRKIKKEQIKENVLFTIIAGFILVATFMLLGNLNNKTVNDCMNAGNNRSYCEHAL